MRENIKINLLKNLLRETTSKYDYFISNQAQKMQQTFELAIKDSLTGLYNREYLDEFSKQAFARHKRHQYTLTVVFLDLDNFKSVNDNHGHLVGDRVLQAAAHLLKESFRKSDIVVRYGGDEFVVLIEDGYFEENKLKSLLKSFTKRVEDEFVKYHISASYGIATTSENIDSIAKLIEVADERMYAHKIEKKRNKNSKNYEG